MRLRRLVRNDQLILALMRSSGEQHVTVVADHEGAVFLGCIHERDVMNAYNKALVQTRCEERGD